jgi:hypothetical protein
MAQLLDALELLQDHRVPQVEIRGGGIHAELHAQRPLRPQRLGEAPAELLPAQEVHGSVAHHVELSLDLALQLIRSHPLFLDIRRSREPWGTASSTWNSKPTP